MLSHLSCLNPPFFLVKPTVRLQVQLQLRGAGILQDVLGGLELGKNGFFQIVDVISIDIYENLYIYIYVERERDLCIHVYIYIVHTSEYIYRRYHMIPRRLQMVSPARLVANLQQGIQTS